jgi:hypothetical protein
MTYVPNRQPEGIPTGGQFAARYRTEGSVLLADARTSARALGDLVRATATTVKERAQERRPATVRPWSRGARTAVLALVLAASAASLTACDSGQDCKTPAAASEISQGSDAAADLSASVEAKGGGGGHGGGGHSSGGHSSSGHTSESSSGGSHTSEGASGTGHVTEEGSSGSSSSGGFHWPWSGTRTGGSGQQCAAPTAAPGN